MTTSPKPWSTRPVDPVNNSSRAELLDATGKAIAFFVDYRDLDALMEAEQGNVTAIQELQDENDKLKGEIAELEGAVNAREDIKNTLQSKLDIIRDTLNA